MHSLNRLLFACQALSDSLSPDTVTHELLKFMLEFSGAQRAQWLQQQDGESGVYAHAETRASGVHVTLLASPVPHVKSAQATLLVPVSDGKASFGVVCLEFPESKVTPVALTDEQSRALNQIARQAGISLRNAIRHARALSDKREAQALVRELRTQAELYALGEQISHTGNWRWDVNENQMVCSAELLRMFDLPSSVPRVFLRKIARRIHHADRGHVTRLALQSAPEKKTIRVEFRVIRRDGSSRYLFAIGRPALSDTDTQIYVGTVTDLTNRRAAEDALRVAQAELARVARVSTVGQLTASIAHEINQPLMSVVSNAGACLRWLDYLPPRLDEIRAGLIDIAQDGARAGDIIRGLRGLTRNADPVFSLVNVHESIEKILAISRSEIERRKVSVVFQPEANPPLVQGDSVQLQQVLLNLVVNALEAMSAVVDRARTLIIRTRVADGVNLEICVQDSGVGIALDKHAAVFEPFYTTKPQGMGMGLAICRSIVEAHCGQLFLEAGVAPGSRLCISLPICVKRPGGP